LNCGVSTSDSDLSLDQLVELERRAAIAAAEADDDGDRSDDDDDTIVLAWWQHPVNVVTMLVASLLIAGLAGWMIGDSQGVAHNEVDTGFLQDMRDHHEQAVLMAAIYEDLSDTNRGLRTVAGSIEFGQAIEIGRMIQLLRDFAEPEANEGDTSMGWMGMATERGRMPGMATDDQLSELQGSSGEAADRLFAELMIAHHEGGVHMAEYARDHAESDAVVSFAESVVAGQRSEIAEIRDQLDT
jgi:uncharacterized protein (DUF305 family)